MAMDDKHRNIRRPLPQSWIDSHQALGQQILERQRELGMTPILQSFTGFVPIKLKEKYPDARIKDKTVGATHSQQPFS